jgi:hypothetical protein
MVATASRRCVTTDYTCEDRDVTRYWRSTLVHPPCSPDIVSCNFLAFATLNLSYEDINSALTMKRRKSQPLP